MVCFHDKPPQIAFIMGKYIFSGQCTDVIGGTLTAGATTAAAASAKLTWSPEFVTAPIILGCVQGSGLAITGPTVRFTGIANSYGYAVLAAGASPISGVEASIMIIGEAKL